MADAVGSNDQGAIDLTWTDKLRKMVSSDAEWEAIILKKMEEKRNKEMGIESQERPSFSVGGLLTKIKSYIPTRKAGAEDGHSQGHDPTAELGGTGDQLTDSQ